jgi:hypothetical protein
VTNEAQPGSIFAAARARRRLAVEEAAARADLDPETVRALEEARVYRFETTQDAIAAALVYATSLGISKREARELVGLPVHPRLVAAVLSARFAAALLFAGAVGAAVWFGVTSRPAPSEPAAAAAAPVTQPATVAPEALPQPWQIEVAVYNGTNRPNAATQVANTIAGLAYTIGEVADAPRKDYPETRVYFAPGGEAIAERLASELGVGTTPLPGGDDPSRLVVIVGRDG